MQDLLKSFVNEVSRVPIGHEGFSKVHSFLTKMLGVRYSNCFGDQSFEDNIFLRRVVTKALRKGMESSCWISMENFM